MIDNLFAQAMGFVALAALLLTYQFNKRSTIIKLKSANNLSYSIHYYLLGSPTAALVQLVAFVRNIFFQHRSKHKYLDHPASLWVWMTIFVVIGIFSWKGLISILALLGIIFGTLGIWVTNTTHIRALSLLSVVSWLIHNIIIISFAGVISGIIGSVSIIVAIVRFDSRRK